MMFLPRARSATLLLAARSGWVGDTLFRLTR